MTKMPVNHYVVSYQLSYGPCGNSSGTLDEVNQYIRDNWRRWSSFGVLAIHDVDPKSPYAGFGPEVTPISTFEIKDVFKGSLTDFNDSKLLPSDTFLLFYDVYNPL